MLIAKQKVLRGIISTFLCALTLATIAHAHEQNSQYEFLRDAEFIRDKLLLNHPGTDNPDDCGFKSLVESGFQQAIRQKDKVVAGQSYRDLLSAYIRNFDDPHLRLDFQTTLEERGQNNTPERHFKCTEIRPGIHWVTIPHFLPDSAQILEIRAIEQQLPACRDAQAIVFDLRSTSGGNSGWGNDILSALFTSEYFDQQTEMLYANMYAEWKTSYDNLRCLRKYLEQSKNRFGKDSPEYKRHLKLAEGVAKALKDMQPYYRERTDQAINIDNNRSQRIANPVKARVIAIVDKSCISAALDFVDMLKALCPLVLVGRTTGWDRVYIDTNSLPLPSGLAYLTYPMKVWRNRPRKDKEAYVPDYRYEDLQDTQGLEQFIFRVISNLSPTDHPTPVAK